MRDVYSAVADPTRRALIRLLADGDELPLHEMTAEFQVGRTAVSKHLAVLKAAGLVNDRKVGRETRYQLNAAPLREIQEWVSFYEQFWTHRLDNLKTFLEKEHFMTENVMSETVSLDVELKCPVANVWHAMTDSATLSEWMMFKTNDFQPVIGHTFQFRDGPGFPGVIDCKVLEVEKPIRLSYTWVTKGQGDVPHSTVVTFTLSGSEHGVTHLHLEQSGFRPDAKQEIAGAKYGWTSMLDQLQSVLASA